MKDPFNHYTKLFEPFANIGDQLGLDRFKHLLGPLSSVERLRHSSLVDVYARQSRSLYPLQHTIASIQRSVSAGYYDHTRSLAAAIDRISDASLIGKSAYRILDVMKSVSSVTAQYSQLGGLFETTSMLQRKMMPWLETHKALLPFDGLVLRMLQPNGLGIASWIDETSAEVEDAPRFEFAALITDTVKPHSNTQTLHITTEVRCFICRGAVFGAEAHTNWVGPKNVDLTIDVVPFCSECSHRDKEEPGYIAARVQELLTDSTTEVPPRVVLEVFSGDETDPVPRGELRLVRDDHDDEE